MNERTDRLYAMLREGRLIRHAWTEGHDRACLLAALSPEAGAAKSASACPAEVMPLWLAHLTPWLDDAPSDEAWPSIVARYAALARRWGVLDAEGWERVRIAALIVIVSEARTHVAPEHARVLHAIDRVLGWLRRGAAESEREAAASSMDAARAAARAAAADAAWAARAAAASAAASADAARAASAADRIAAGVLDAIERKIERMEAAR